MVIDKWAGHPASQYAYNIKGSDFFMHVGIETLSPGPRYNNDSQTIPYFKKM